MKRVARQLGLFCLALAGCSSTAAPLTLTTPSGTRALAAWYGVFLEPLETGDGGLEVQLVVSLVDPAFRCDGGGSGLDALSFAFDEQAGASTSMVLARSGPLFGHSVGASGAITLDAVDDRFQGAPDGKPDVAPGGHVAGHAQLALAAADGTPLRLAGSFTAPHCAQLDFVVSP